MLTGCVLLVCFLLRAVIYDYFGAQKVNFIFSKEGIFLTEGRHPGLEGRTRILWEDVEELKYSLEDGSWGVVVVLRENQFSEVKVLIKKGVDENSSFGMLTLCCQKCLATAWFYLVYSLL